MSSLLQLSKKEIEECQEIVNNFRVNELHLLLTSYHYPKLGKKQDLVSRAQSILLNPKYQLSAVQKVREIQANNRIRSAAQPYLSNNSMQSSSNSGDFLRRQQYQSGGAGGISRTQMHSQSHVFGGNQYHGANTYGGGGTYSHFQSGSNSSGSLLFGQQHHNSSAQPASVSQVQNGQVRNLRIVDLPFYNVRSIVTQLTELPAFSMQPRPGEARVLCQFGMNPEDIARVSYRGDDRPLPRFEIQLRIFQLDTSEEQADSFPPGCTVKVDDYNVTLPNIIPTNKPNAEQKRLSRPVNLTPYCQNPRSRERPHRMVIEWNGDKRAWAFGIYIVHRVNAQILQDRIMQNVNARRAFESTKNTIVRRLQADEDDGIQMDTLKISLLCPLMRTPIKIPSRAADCTHLQSFDLTNYLMMCEKRPVWKCPVCDNNATYSKLIVDEYFQTLLRSVGDSVEEVELLKDGTWRIIQEEVMDLSDEDDDVVVASSSSKNVKKAPVAIAPREAAQKSPTQTPKPNQDDVITLSDSDDDEELPSNVNNLAISRSDPPSNASSNNKSSSPDKAGRSGQGSNQGKQSNDDSDNSSDHSIICLGAEESRNIGSGSNSNPSNALRAGSTPLVSSTPPCLPSVGNGVPSVPSNAINGDNHWVQQTSVPSETMMNGALRQRPQQQQQQHLSYNGGTTPMLQTNGFFPAIFKPQIDEAAKTQVAKELANFLQAVYQKNST